MAAARFVPPESTLEDFIEEQANKNKLSKTKRDVMRMKGKDEEFENVEPRELDEIQCAFILAVKKKNKKLKTKRTEENMNQERYGRFYSAFTASYGRRLTPQPS